MTNAVLAYTFFGSTLVSFANAIKQIFIRDVEDGDSSYGQYIWGL